MALCRGNNYKEKLARGGWAVVFTADILYQFEKNYLIIKL